MPLSPEDSPFEVLADIIASDRLMVFTGSGISNGLEDQDGQKLPDWKDLLLKVKDEISLDSSDEEDVEVLLSGTPNGQEMIEAASILARNEAAFDKQLIHRLTPAASQPPDVAAEQAMRHDTVLRLQPKGIVTLNIDRGHERALDERGQLDRWCRVNPLETESERRIREWLANRDQPLLLEAHGSLKEPDAGFVFTHQAYRELLQKNPAYRALLRQLFADYSFLFVGFGMTDLDFDQFLHEHSMDFGEPLQRHVVVRKAGTTQANQRQAVRYRRRFGIHVLDVDDYPQVWETVRKAMDHQGPELRRSLDLSLALDGAPEEAIAKRRQGHRRLRALGPAGRSVATGQLLKIILREADPERIAEAIYSLGHLRYGPEEASREEAKKALFAELETPRHVERVAHALSVIEKFLVLADLARLEQAARILRHSALTAKGGGDDPDRRTLVYIEAVILRLRASHGHYPPRDLPPMVPDTR